MDANEILDLSVAVVVVGTEAQLANRLDSSINSVKSVEGRLRRLVGLQGLTADLGILIARLEQVPVITLDLALLSAVDQIIPMDIPVPLGQELKLFALSSNGTAVVSIAAHIAIGG